LKVYGSVGGVSLHSIERAWSLLLFSIANEKNYMLLVLWFGFILAYRRPLHFN